MWTISPSPLDKFLARTRLPWPWFIVLCASVLFLLPVAMAYLAGVMDEFLHEGEWRYFLIQPTIIVYILALQWPMEQYRAYAVTAFRPLVQINDEAFGRVVREASDVNDRTELIGFVAGALFGFLTNAPWHLEQEQLLLRVYFSTMGALMFGLLGWVIVVSLSGTRLESALYRQPLAVDIFDLSPFVPFARNSLLISLAFVGGSVISALFVNPLSVFFDNTLGDASRLLLIIVLPILYGVMGLVAVLVFFLGMRHAHRVLAGAKADELAEVERNIAGAFRALKRCKENGEDVGPVATELNLWLKYEERLQQAKTWPYNTAMLRTLFLSILLPAILSVAQRQIIAFLTRLVGGS